MRVTFFHRHPIPGGYSIERLFMSIRQALPENISYSVSVASFPSKGIIKRLLNSLEVVWKQSDINHITGDIHYVALFLKKRATILTIHDCIVLKRLKGLKRAILFIFWYWLPEKRCSLITVVSESTRNELMRYLRCNPSKIRVVPNCIIKGFNFYPRKFNSVKPRILQIGVTENKNLIRLATALEGISCHLRIIGKLTDIQKEALYRHRIEYTAFSDISDTEIIQNYKDCDLVVLVSTYEGFGLPIIEANAIGRPVVTSNILSMAEVAGDAACLVDPFNVDSIKAGILRIIKESNYRDYLIQNGINNIEKYKPNIIVDQYIKLYQEILSTP